MMSYRGIPWHCDRWCSQSGTGHGSGRYAGECDQRWRSRLRDRDTHAAGTGAIYCQEQKSDQYESLAWRR